ncbi:hypothetical protein MMC15_004037 [Xylographa vitiligo]|nr:hypothetical protein [Xylographa vitiligo]
MGWQFDDKYAVHQKLGGAFILVTPSVNELILADPEAITQVQARRKDFVKPPLMYEQMNIFGPNVNTTNGEEWQRHRKITAPSFNERISSVVWSEALQQSQELVQIWVRKGLKGTCTTVPDTATLALHVLTCAAFGMQYSFSEGVQRLQVNHSMTYRDSLAMILNSIIVLAIFPKSFLQASVIPLPRKLRAIGDATREFAAYMEEMLTAERRLISSGRSDTRNLMNALIRASDEAKAAEAKGKTVSGLTDEEIFGNLFMYNLAGHETTANTLAYAIILLAAHPEYQEWIAAEIDAVLTDNSNIETWKYGEVFPKLNRCLAIMLETLRIYGPTPFIPRITSSTATTNTLSVQSRTFPIPPNTNVTINVQALHTNPHVWGPDALTWRPERWIQSGLRPEGKASQDEPNSFASESLVEAPKGTYIPWADGPRNCPGQKFARVEFVAVIATLFRNARVRSSEKPGGETPNAAKKRILAILEQSSIQAITLQMPDGGRGVNLVWEGRHKS